MNKDTLKTHALMLLNMYGVKEKDIKDRPGCLNVFLNEVLEQPKEKWEEEFDNYKIGEYGKWKIGRVEAKDFIRETIKTEREQAIKEERKRLLNLIKTAIDNLYRITPEPCDHDYIDTCDIYKILQKLKK
jgi:hypothetical protein